MPLSLKQHHKLSMADRTQDAGWIAAVVEDLPAANTTPHAVRDRPGPSRYLCAKPFDRRPWQNVSGGDRRDAGVAGRGWRRRWRPDLSPRLNRGSGACLAANALHEKRSRRVRRDVDPLVAGLAENAPAHTDARFVVETMGTAIRERIHNAHMVRVILRDIFGHSGNITQIAKPQSTIHRASQSQMSTSSRFRFIVGAAG